MREHEEAAWLAQCRVRGNNDRVLSRAVRSGGNPRCKFCFCDNPPRPGCPRPPHGTGRPRVLVRRRHANAVLPSRFARICHASSCKTTSSPLRFARIVRRCYRILGTATAVPHRLFRCRDRICTVGASSLALRCLFGHFCGLVRCAPAARRPIWGERPFRASTSRNERTTSGQSEVHLQVVLTWQTYRKGKRSLSRVGCESRLLRSRPSHGRESGVGR